MSTGSRSAAVVVQRGARRTPRNSGCGRVGREVNSGCAWVPTKNGCSSRGSSTYSTSRPSGDVPEHDQPGLLAAGPGSRCSPRTGAGAGPRPRSRPYASATSEPAHQLLRVRAEPHRAAHVPLAGDDVDLVGHRGDHRVRGRPGRTRSSSRPSSPARCRAVSITMHCRPRQRPRAGMPRSRAYRIAPSLPSMPRTPKPPGTSTPSTPDSAAAAPAGVRAVVARAPSGSPPGRGARTRRPAAPRSPTGTRPAGRRTCRPARP